ncbi:MAG: AMP-binding protein [Dehalococcoidia bacterium]|nr:AMP-binding protein [Dehalococcoidia bacterium]
MNLKQMLERTASEVPEKTALVLGSRRLSYKGLDDTSSKVANLLMARGMEKGDHVAILMSHSPEWMVNYFGIIKAGGVAVLLNPRLKAAELNALLRESDAKILLTEEGFSRELIPLLAGTSLAKHILETDGDDYKTLVISSSPSAPDVKIDDADVSTIIYTSGVMGKQKGVMHTHASLLGTPDIVSTGVGRDREDVVIDAVPFFYLFGLSEVFFGSAIKGSTVIIIPSFTPRAILAAVEKERGSIFFGVPAMHNALAMLREKVIRNYDTSSLRVASTAGAKSSPRLMKMLEDKFNLVLCETYGLSELSVVSMSTLANRKLGTVGKPLGEISVLNDSGKEVAVGETGEAVVRVPWAMKGYYKAPDLTAKVFKDGWFYTGDLVKMDEDGYLEYVEKKSFIIVTDSGLKISPWEVEEVLLRYPGIAEVAFAGVKDTRGGQIPTAFVVPSDGEHISPEAITSFCSQNLAEFKLPRKIKILSSLPKTGSGKIDRRQLQEG